ncbi:MAG: zinc-dependent peptidase [Verrucomicrobiota bacterium]|nr:zinc-dependent peptidase [Verrucomicrobiota bacterium]
MILKWFKKRKRIALLKEPFPQNWLQILENNVALYSLVSKAEQSHLQSIMRIFISEKNWEGCNGQEINDEIKVTIAGNVSVMLLAMKHDYFSHMASVLVYPSGYQNPAERKARNGVIMEGNSARLGEAWEHGPVVLAWDCVLEQSRDPYPGRNVVVHEFAHQLDFMNGFADGTPLLKSKAQYIEWHAVMKDEYERLVEDSIHGRVTLLDDYAATNPAEFFAVASECFFENPLQMAHKHHKLYDVLKGYYRQDTAMRMSHKRQKEKL